MFGRNRTVSFDLSLAKRIECLLKIGSLASDLFHGVVKIELTLNRHLDRFVIGIANERVAGPDIEIDVGKWLDADVFCGRVGGGLGRELKEEAKLTDFNRLFHDIDTEEVA